MFYKLCRADCVSFLEQIGGVNSRASESHASLLADGRAQPRVSNEGVMRASQLSEPQQDAKKGSKRSEWIDIPERSINQNL